MTFITVTQNLLEGFVITCLLFLFTLALSMPLGLLISFCSMSKFKPLKATSKTFVWIIRGVPLMLQLFIVYYLPGLLSETGINVFGKIDNLLYFKYGIDNGGAFIAAVIAFVINYACYFSEIFRGGIEGIPKGQFEAGQVLGLTKREVFFKVVLLQVVKRIIPPMSNEIITLIKDTSLANTIAVYELIYEAKEFMVVKGLIWPLFVAGGFYLIFVGILTIVFGKIEKKLDYFKA